MTEDESLLHEMWCAYTLHATPKPFNVREAMAAVLAVVRADDRDGGRYRWLCANPLWPDAVCVAMSDGDKPALDAAIDAAMREDGE